MDVKNSSGHRIEQLKRKLSHLGHIVSIKTESKNELASGEKIPSENQKNPPPCSNRRNSTRAISFEMEHRSLRL